MKKIISMLPLLLIVGCSSPEPINYEETLNYRGGVYYTKDTNQPYSGPIFSLDKKGRNKKEGILEDGKMISETNFEYYETGQKGKEISSYYDKDRMLVLMVETRWYKTGQKESENKDKGNGESSFTDWYLNGQKKWELKRNKDGKEIIKKWNEDGSVKE